MSTFSARVKSVINDNDLQIALSKATTKLSSGREASIASLENADLIRDMARRAKLNILHNLDENLLKFEHRLIDNGVNVHWAEKGTDACEVVIKIAQKRGIKKVAKSKSMVSEEIHLNEALIKAGLQVIETDLGEYIVQLADDRPSHIIAPIMHMTRHRVGEIMHRHLNVPYTDDIKELARYAREKLRSEFLSAEIGITGANFGVVETGTICIVTNEGNARMVTTLPKIHIVIMSLEKLVPTLADLDLMLKILARSATGQKLTSYTTLIHGPKVDEENVGPEEVHVILLDNGRTGIFGSEQAEILGCIRCGACLNICPVYKNIGGHAYGDVYPGPIGSVLTPGLKGLLEWKDLPYASSLCGACKDVCPVRLDIPQMLLSLRKNAIKEKIPFGLKIGMKGFGIITAYPGLYKFIRNIGSLFLRLIGRDGWIKRFPANWLIPTDLLNGWTKVRDFKVPARKSFQDMWIEREKSYE
ncbi:hypothetical protein AMJ80_04710 [bacterium SM23_31]|nr:MAG: hypothetical protein AMJ80_04710 [bacterium SM23_31]